MAARQLGLNPIGIELDADACATRHAAGLRTIRADVTTLEPRGPITGLFASPPCIDWSVAGLRRGYDGSSGHLVDEPMRWVKTLRPRWVAFEQVPTVLPVWKRHGEVMRELGYSVWVGKLHAEQFGVPQTRTRAILMARLDDEVAPPVPTHSRYHTRSPQKLDEGVLPWISMTDVLRWGLTHRPLQRSLPASMLASTQRGGGSTS